MQLKPPMRSAIPLTILEGNQTLNLTIRYEFLDHRLVFFPMLQVEGCLEIDEYRRQV